MLMSTTELINTNKKRKLIELQNYFSGLPITNICVVPEDIIYETKYYTEEVGLFCKKTVQRSYTVISTRVNFTYDNKSYFIYLNDEIMKNKPALYFDIRTTVGIR